MPDTEVVFYKDHDGTAPVYETIRELLRRGRRKEFAKFQVRINRLAEQGHELRRPAADYLRDGVYELRVVHRRVHYRVLYFYHGRQIVVLSHMITKEGRVPDSEIDRAVRHRVLFGTDPERHTFRI
jgi:phage-related protein